MLGSTSNPNNRRLQNGSSFQDTDISDEQLYNRLNTLQERNTSWTEDMSIENKEMLEEVLNAEISENTKKNYGLIIKRFKTYLKDNGFGDVFRDDNIDARKLKENHVTSYFIEEFKKKKRSPSGMGLIYSAINDLYRKQNLKGVPSEMANVIHRLRATKCDKHANK